MKLADAAEEGKGMIMVREVGTVWRTESVPDPSILADGVDRRRRGKDRCAGEESGEL